jgi:hypothetical protein
MIKPPIATLSIMAALASLGVAGLGDPDRYALKVPDGLSFSEFSGYENWAPVAVDQTQTGLKLISANAVMMKAFKMGLPAKDKAFPEGSKIVKVEWSMKENPASPHFVRVPDVLKSVEFIEKDSKRFPQTHGWAYAQFLYDPATKSFKPNGTGAQCGYACHSIVAAQDFTFTAYPAR